MRKMIIELFGYGMVSVVALAVDIATLRTLVEHAGWHYIPASALSFVLGAAVAYPLLVRFVFHFHVISNRAREFTCFVLLGLVGLFVNALALSVAIGVAGLGLVAAKSLAAICTFSTNFLLRRRLLFSTASVSVREEYLAHKKRCRQSPLPFFFQKER